MFKKKKIKFSFLFVVVLSAVLVILAVLMSFFFISSIKQFGNFTTKANEESIRNQASYLLKKNIESTAQYYSSILNKITVNSKLIAGETGKLYDLYKKMGGENKDASALELRKGLNGILYNNFSYKDLAVIIYTKSNSKGKERKGDSEHSTLNIEEKEKVQMEQVYKRTALYLIFEMNELINSNAKRTPYMYDISIIFDFDRYYSGLYPNMISEFDSNSVKEWERGIVLVKKYINLPFFKDVSGEEPKTIWSSIHYSMEDKPILSVVTPIVSRKDGFIGVIGTTLRVETVLEDIMGYSTTPQYEFGILDKNKKYKKYTGTFSFIINNKKELIAFPGEDADLLALPKIDLNKEKSFHGGLLTDSENLEIKALAELMGSTFSGTMTIKLKGSPYIFAYCRLKTGWSLCTAIPEYEFLSSVRSSNDQVKLTTKQIIKDIIIITIILLCISVFCSLFFFHIYLLKPINTLADAVRHIGKGNFNINIEPKGTAEIEELAETFNYLCRELKEYEANLKKEIEQRQIIETEVKVAGDIQTSLLPQITEDFIRKEFSLAALLASAKDASGDYYDFFYVDKNKLAVLIADVSGKGISAAFFMALAKTLIKSICLQFKKHDPAEVLTIANNILNRDNSKLMFVTAFLAFYDIDTGLFTYSNAGHHEALLLTADAQCSEFGLSKQMAMGVMPDIQYTFDSIELNFGEKIILYTDGVTEAVDPENNEYGLVRLKNLIMENKNSTCDSLAETIVGDILKFEDGNRFDDITLLILQRKNNK